MVVFTERTIPLGVRNTPPSSPGMG